ncbi:uncharacterized protein LOC134746941 [Cydia strobilella]|uniref:uncharacterized protein LOC134746941 n=1 Tax=Cydia strobilella TaxID=1100964 RepID=UPI00300669DB
MLVLLCACAYLAAGAAEPALQGSSRWSVASSVLLSDAATTGGELGYRLQAALTLRAQPLEEGLLLHFTLESPQLMLRGKHQNAEFLPKPSIWDSMPSSEFLAVWSEGHITEALLDPADPPDVLDYKKALISLFQFQVEEGERNETDVSGYCHVHYDAVSELVFRKSKMQCTWQETVDEDENDGCAERRRVVRYELAPGGVLKSITADEVLLLRGTDRTHALKARALHMLALAGAPAPAPAPAPAGLAAARERLPALQPAPLPLELRPESDDDPKESLSSALSAHRAAVEEARAGSAEAAAATLALLPAIRAATANELTALLDHPDTDELEGLVRVLGLAGSRGAHLAARETLQLQAKEPPREHLGREYLAALAIAPEVEEFVIRDAMKLGAAGGALAPAASLAAAAATATHRPRPRPRHRAPPTARDALTTEVKNSLTRSLSKCKEDACSAARILALGQLRRPELVELFLEHAEKGERATALAAIAALRAVAKEGYSYYGPQRRRLQAAALGLLARPRPLDVRAAALELLLLSAADRPLALCTATVTTGRSVDACRPRRWACSHGRGRWTCARPRSSCSYSRRPTARLRCGYSYYGPQRRRLQAAALGLLARPRPLDVRAAALELLLLSAADRPLALCTATVTTGRARAALTLGGRPPACAVYVYRAMIMFAGLQLLRAALELLLLSAADRPLALCTATVTTGRSVDACRPRRWACSHGRGRWTCARPRSSCSYSRRPTARLRCGYSYYGPQRRRLQAAALGLLARPRPLDVRAAALELLLLSAADRPLALLGLTRGLREHGPRELRRLCWLRLQQLAATRAELAMLLPSLDPRPRDWFRRAHDGTSSVLERAAQWARLDSSQLASAGVLSRGKVELAAHTPVEELHLLTVEIWTRGMESFATPPVIPGAAREAEDELKPEEEEAVEGGLALTVGGVRRPDVTLFNGQGELLGHIWSGTGSSPTPVLRAVLPRGHVTHHYALQAGLVLRGRVQQALALAQDAQVTLLATSGTGRPRAARESAAGAGTSPGCAGNVAGHVGHGCLPTPIPRGHVTHHYALQAGLVLRGRVQQALALAQDAQVTLLATSATGRPRAARESAAGAGTSPGCAGNVAGHVGHGCLPTPIPRGHVTHHYALQAGLVLRGRVQQALALAQDAQVTLLATSGTGRPRAARESAAGAGTSPGCAGNVAGHVGHGCLPTPIPRGHVTHHYALQAGLVLRGRVQQALALAQDAQVTLLATSATGRPRAARESAAGAGTSPGCAGNVAGHVGHGCLPTPIPRGHVTHHYALQAGLVLRGRVQQALALAQDAQVTLLATSGTGNVAGHVGHGCLPTPIPRGHVTHHYALQAGLVLRGRVQQALALAQDAQAQVSLWGRTARAGLALRGAGVESRSLRLRTRWGGVTAHAHAHIQPELTIAAALDFYDKPQLCVHTAVPDYTYSRNVTLESVLGAGALRVRRARVTSRRVPGRTLALGAPNDAACAALGAEHQD